MVGAVLYEHKGLMLGQYNYLYQKYITMRYVLSHLRLASFLWDIGKQYSPRCDAAERGVPSGANLFA